jgi:cytochrome c biogenesis protein ResB
MINRVWKLFKSVRFAALIIALLILVYFLGLVIPQKWLFQTRAEYDEWIESNWVHAVFDFIGFTDIYLSPLAIVLLALFFSSLLVVTINRIPVIMKKAFLTTAPLSISLDTIKNNTWKHVLHAQGDADSVFAGIRNFFEKKRWYLIEGEEGNVFLALKNRLSPIGFLFFHVSFFLCLIGGLLIMYTRFSGKLVLTEGQAFHGDMKQFHKITSEPGILKELPDIALYLEKVHPSYEGDIPTDLTVELQVKSHSRSVKEILRINDPVKRGALSIMAETVGISPLFVLKDQSGRVVDSAFVSLKVLQGREDSFDLKLDGLYTFLVRFSPDYTLRQEVETTKSMDIRNPAFHLVIQKDFIHTIFEGTVKLGEPVTLDSHTIIFRDLRYWTELQIVREYGKVPLIAGFLSALLGLIMRLLFYQKRVRLAVEFDTGESVVYIDGKSEYFHYSFREEMERIVNQLDIFLRASERSIKEHVKPNIYMTDQKSMSNNEAEKI